MKIPTVHFVLAHDDEVYLDEPLPDSVISREAVFKWVRDQFELLGYNPSSQRVWDLTERLREERAKRIREATAASSSPPMGGDPRGGSSSLASRGFSAKDRIPRRGGSYALEAAEPRIAGDPTPTGWVVRDMRELRKLGFRVEWLIKQWWPVGKHGMLAGAQKSLKSWLGVFEALSIASGKPLFGKFEVAKQGPVLVFTGEGSAGLWWSWMVNAAKSYGLSDKQIDALPIRVCDDVGQFVGDNFQATLRRELDDFKPVLVMIDPLYCYVGGDSEAGNVFEMGSILTSVSAITNHAGVALQIMHHTRKEAGVEPSLTDITQAGSREWVSSWVLASHREPPDLEAQRFQLRLKVGGRDGYGGNWDLDICLGPLDDDGVRHAGKVSWSIKPASETAAEDKADLAEARMLQTQLTLARMGSATRETFSEEANLSLSEAGRRLAALADVDKAAITRGERGLKTYTPIQVAGGAP